MEERVSVAEVVRDPARFHGRRLSIEGQFIAMFDGAAICAPSPRLQLTPERPHLPLDHPDVETPCFQFVSPYAGGPYYYNDPAVVTGLFLADPPRMTDLSTVVIRRGEQEYTVPLGRAEGLG